MEKIGFIGLGNLGGKLAESLLRNKFNLTVMDLNDNLVKDFNLFKISSGDLLREEVEKGNELGNKIKSLIDKGSFVPDDIIDDLVKNVISNKSYNNRLVFDGYPRNLNQAKKLDILTLAGGGDTISAIKLAKAENGFTYISRAGGAFLECIEGKELPGIKALEDNIMF